VSVSISGCGQDGPYPARPVFDPIILGGVGLVAHQVNPQLPIPDLVRSLVVDKTAALTAAQAITAALLVKARGGSGQRIRVPMLNSALYFYWPDGMMDHIWLDEGVSPGVTIADTRNSHRDRRRPAGRDDAAGSRMGVLFWSVDPAKSQM
jgi:crotonobetainyl-CoA:carnitine CoA-transferase CaiB-like acyl-CoA transferase